MALTARNKALPLNNYRGLVNSIKCEKNLITCSERKGFTCSPNYLDEALTCVLCEANLLGDFFKSQRNSSINIK